MGVEAHDGAPMQLAEVGPVAADAADAVTGPAGVVVGRLDPGGLQEATQLIEWRSGRAAAKELGHVRCGRWVRRETPVAAAAIAERDPRCGIRSARDHPA